MGFRQVKGIYSKLDKSSTGEKPDVELSNEETVIELSEVHSESVELETELVSNEESEENLEADSNKDETELDDDDDTNESEPVMNDDSLPNALKLLTEKENEETTDSIPTKRKYNKSKKKKASKQKKSVSNQT